jgi:hypothetical protein
MTQYRLTVSGTYGNGRKWSFRQHYVSAASLATILADWKADWEAAWTTATTGLGTVAATTTSFTGLSAAELVSTGGSPYREQTKLFSTVSHAGTGSGDSLPSNSAILVSRRTAAVGGRNRGRTYLFAPCEAAQADGVLDATTAGHVTTSITGVRTAMVASGHTPVIYNTKTSVHDPFIQNNKTITSEETDRVLRNQRRRSAEQVAIYV